MLPRACCSCRQVADTVAVQVCDRSQSGALGRAWAGVEAGPGQELGLPQPASPDSTNGHRAEKQLVPSCPEPFSGLIASWVLVFLNRQPHWGGSDGSRLAIPDDGLPRTPALLCPPGCSAQGWDGAWEPGLRGKGLGSDLGSELAVQPQLPLRASVSPRVR